jgi:hypothetical protein
VTQEVRWNPRCLHCSRSFAPGTEECPICGCGTSSMWVPPKQSFLELATNLAQAAWVGLLFLALIWIGITLVNVL